MHVSGARLFLGADRRNFKDNCDSKHECDTIKGYGSTEEAAKRYFPREISEVIDEHAGQRKKPGDRMNPTLDAFKLKYLQALQEEMPPEPDPTEGASGQSVNSTSLIVITSHFRPILLLPTGS